MKPSKLNYRRQFWGFMHKGIRWRKAV